MDLESPLVLSDAVCQHIRAQRGGSDTVEAYLADQHRYVELIAPLVSGADRLLDIGGGLGITIALLAKKMTAEFVLLDANGKGSLAGFSPATKYIGNNKLAEEFLRENNVSAQVADVRKGFPTGRFDAVISRRAWVWHFPAKVYLRDVCKALTPDGVVIVDYRHAYSKRQLADMEECFGEIRELESNKKGAVIACYGPR